MRLPSFLQAVLAQLGEQSPRTRQAVSSTLTHSSISRRGFLQALVAAAPAVALAPTLDLERLLWVPGEKTIFVPSLEQIGEHTLVCPEWVMHEVMQRLIDSLKFNTEIHRSYDREFRLTGARVGYDVNARLPIRYQVRTL